jgi:hypothetical protein
MRQFSMLHQPLTLDIKAFVPNPVQAVSRVWGFGAFAGNLDQESAMQQQKE